MERERSTNHHQYDVIIVGGGPAGLSAALILGRCRRRVLVCDAGRPRNAQAHHLHGYLTRDCTPPADLLRLGREEIAGYGVEFRPTIVTGAQCRPEGVEATLEQGDVIVARKLLLATGVTDELPEIEGLRELYGRSVHHCPYCDGWEWRDRPLAAYGDPSHATGLALSLLTWSRDLVVCTNGQLLGRRDRKRLADHGIPFRSEKIARLEGEAGRLERIIFEHGEPLARSALFFNTSQGQRSSLAGRLGCRFNEKGHVRTDRRGRTGVPNLFLAGDAQGEVQFVIVAAAQGAQAAVVINAELQKDDRGEQ